MVQFSFLVQSPANFFIGDALRNPDLTGEVIFADSKAVVQKQWEGSFGLFFFFLLFISSLF